MRDGLFAIAQDLFGLSPFDPAPSEGYVSVNYFVTDDKGNSKDRFDGYVQLCCDLMKQMLGTSRPIDGQYMSRKVFDLSNRRVLGPSTFIDYLLKKKNKKLFMLQYFVRDVASALMRYGSNRFFSVFGGIIISCVEYLDDGNGIICQEYRYAARGEVGLTVEPVRFHPTNEAEIKRFTSDYDTKPVRCSGRCHRWFPRTAPYLWNDICHECRSVFYDRYDEIRDETVAAVLCGVADDADGFDTLMENTGDNNQGGADTVNTGTEGLHEDLASLGDPLADMTAGDAGLNDATNIGALTDDDADISVVDDDHSAGDSKR